MKCETKAKIIVKASAIQRKIRLSTTETMFEIIILSPKGKKFQLDFEPGTCGLGDECLIADLFQDTIDSCWFQTYNDPINDVTPRPLLKRGGTWWVLLMDDDDDADDEMMMRWGWWWGWRWWWWWWWIHQQHPCS